MVNWLNKALSDVIHFIIDSDDYQTCLRLKEKMRSNSSLMKLVEDLKKTQKEYVKSGYDPSFLDKLKQIEEELYQIPIYVIYMEHLENVNQMISYVQDDLNDYFYHLCN